MTEDEILNIMASDMKLWDAAETSVDGPNTVTKTLELPFGIGTYSVTLEGMRDADKKRAAVGGYANHIRQIIKERIDDEAVTSRAKAKAARVEQSHSEDSTRRSPEGIPESSTVPETVHQAAEAHEADAQGTPDLGADLIARRTSLTERIGRVESDLVRWKREARALDAAIEALEKDDE